MVYGRSKAVPPPATPFEEFMATASERMTAARLELVEFLRELPPAAWITVGAVVVLLAASSLNWRGKKEASVEPAATTNAAAAEARAPAKPAVAVCAEINVVASMAWGGRGDSYLVPRRSTRPPPPPKSKAPRRSTPSPRSSASTRRPCRWRPSTRPPH